MTFSQLHFGYVILLGMIIGSVAACSGDPPAADLSPVTGPPPATPHTSAPVIRMEPEENAPFSADEYRDRVKHLDAFFARINFREDAYGRRILADPSEADQLTLLKELLSRACRDTLSSTTWMAFARDLLADTIRLELRNDRWFARVSYHATWRERPTQLDLALRLEFPPAGGSRWVLVGARGEFLQDLLPFGQPGAPVLSPEAHELDFLRLAVNLAEPDRLPAMTYADHSVDYLSVVYYLLRSGALRLGTQAGIELHLLQLPGWRLTLRNLAGRAVHSGWRITAVRPADEAAKNLFLLDSLGITDRRWVSPPVRSGATPAAPLRLDAAHRLALAFAEQMSGLFTSSEQPSPEKKFNALFALFTHPDARVPDDRAPQADRLPLWRYLERLTDEYARAGVLTVQYDVAVPANIELKNRRGIPYALIPVKKTINSDRILARERHEVIVVDLAAGKIDQIRPGP